MRQVKTSPMKLNLVAKLVRLPSLSTPAPVSHSYLQIRRLSISDALAQMKFSEKKASKFVETVKLKTFSRGFFFTKIYFLRLFWMPREEQNTHMTWILSIYTLVRFATRHCTLCASYTLDT